MKGYVLFEYTITCINNLFENTGAVIASNCVFRSLQNGIKSDFPMGKVNFCLKTPYIIC